MKNPKYRLYLTQDERRMIVNGLIKLRNSFILDGKYTDVIDELIFKLTKSKVKRIKLKEV